MLFDAFIMINNKIFIEKFVVQKYDNRISLDITMKYKDDIYLVLYIEDGIFYEKVCFPLYFDIMNDDEQNNYLFTPYILYINFDYNNLMKETIENKISFFNIVAYNIYKDYNYRIYNITDFINKKIKLSSLKNIINTEKIIDIKIFCLYLLYLSIYNENIDISIIPTDIIDIYKTIVILKYNIYNIDNADQFIFNKHFNSYNNKKFILQKTFNNNKITQTLIDHLYSKLEISDIDTYFSYYKINKMNILNYIIDDNIILNILNSNEYTKDFFKSMTEKYFNNKIMINKILNILFKKYTFPLKLNKSTMITIFDYIIYFSLYNHNLLFSENNIIHPNIPIKFKNLYLTIIKLLINIINFNFKNLYNDKRLYLNLMYKNILRLYILPSNYISTILFKYLCKDECLTKTIYIYFTLSSLFYFIEKFEWNDLLSKIHYLNLFYDYNNIIIYNNNLIPLFKDNITDNRIIYSITNPFYIYRFLIYEKDIIRWTHRIKEYIYLIYQNIDICDYIFIFSKFILLLYNIKIQDIQDTTYIQFVSYCNAFPFLILENNKINDNLNKFLFPVNTPINLGILLKHIIYFK